MIIYLTQGDSRFINPVFYAVAGDASLMAERVRTCYWTRDSEKLRFI